jgi:hypothetical protein
VISAFAGKNNFNLKSEVPSKIQKTVAALIKAKICQWIEGQKGMPYPWLYLRCSRAKNGKLCQVVKKTFALYMM